MEERGIVHRDIKPSNVIYDEETEKVKLVDFGLSSSKKEDLKYFCGTPGFIAPEIYYERDLNCFGSKIDIFSL